MAASSPSTCSVDRQAGRGPAASSSGTTRSGPTRASAAELALPEDDRGPLRRQLLPAAARDRPPAERRCSRPGWSSTSRWTQAETHHALVELEAAGVVMQPGQQPPEPQHPAGRRRPQRPEAPPRRRSGRRDREAGRGGQAVAGRPRTPSADKGRTSRPACSTLIFGSANPQEVALAFLHGDEHDAEIEKKAAQNELRRPARTSASTSSSPPSTTLANLRERLARHVLLTDLIAGLGEHVPASLSSVKVATSPGGVDACVRLARSWRNSRDVRDSYVAAAQQGRAGVLASASSTSTRERSSRIETFLAVERALLRHVEADTAGDGPPTTCSQLADVPAVPVLGRGDPSDPGTLGADRRRRRGAAGSRPGGARRSRSPRPPSPPSSKPTPRATSRGACSTPTTGTWRAASTTSSSTPATSTRAGEAHHQGRAAVHRGRLGAGEALRHPVPEGQAPDQGAAAAAGLLRDAGEAEAGRGQGRLRLGGRPAVRDGP